MQSLVISLIIWLRHSFIWMVYLILLAYFGGVLIMFTYVTRLAINELENKITFIPFFTALAIIFIFLKRTLPSQSKDLFIDPTLKIYNILKATINPMINIIILYLLLALLVVIKITRRIKGPFKYIAI